MSNFKPGDEVFYFEYSNGQQIFLYDIMIASGKIDRIDYDMLQTEDILLVNPCEGFKSKKDAIEYLRKTLRELEND